MARNDSSVGVPSQPAFSAPNRSSTTSPSATVVSASAATPRSRRASHWPASAVVTVSPTSTAVRPPTPSHDQATARKITAATSRQVAPSPSRILGTEAALRPAGSGRGGGAGAGNGSAYERTGGGGGGCGRRGLVEDVATAGAAVGERRDHVPIGPRRGTVAAASARSAVLSPRTQVLWHARAMSRGSGQDRDLAECFISVDVETGGATPADYALLSIGACLVDDPETTFYVELKPEDKRSTQEALEVSKLSLDILATMGEPPAEAMQRFADWVGDVVPDGLPADLRRLQRAVRLDVRGRLLRALRGAEPVRLRRPGHQGVRHGPARQHVGGDEHERARPEVLVRTTARASRSFRRAGPGRALPGDLRRAGAPWKGRPHDRHHCRRLGRRRHPSRRVRAAARHRAGRGGHRALAGGDDAWRRVSRRPTSSSTRRTACSATASACSTSAHATWPGSAGSARWSR